MKPEEDDKTKVPVVITSSQVSDEEHQTAPVGLGKIMNLINFLNEIFIILDCDTALSEEKEAKPQSERKQLGKITMIVMCTIVSVLVIGLRSRKMQN